MFLPMLRIRDHIARDIAVVGDEDRACNANLLTCPTHSTSSGHLRSRCTLILFRSPPAAERFRELVWVNHY